MTTHRTRSYAQRTPFDVAAQIAALTARITGTHDPGEAITAPDRDEWLPDWDGDRRSDADENRRWRGLP